MSPDAATAQLYDQLVRDLIWAVGSRLPIFLFGVEYVPVESGYQPKHAKPAESPDG